MLALPHHRSEVVAGLMDWLADHHADELALVGFREDAVAEIAAHWSSSAQEGFASESPYVSLSALRADGDDYLSHLSRNTRAQVRRSRRAYEDRFGPLSLAAATPDRIDGWFDEMVALHEDRWHPRGEPGAFPTEERRRFHLQVLHRGVGRPPGETGADLFRVSAGAETIGILYCIRSMGHVSFYQAGLAYHDDNRLKPGYVSHGMAVGHYLRNGEAEYDFLGGEHESVQYKRSLSTDRRSLAWVELPASTLKMRSLRVLRQIRRRAVASLESEPRE